MDRIDLSSGIIKKRHDDVITFSPTPNHDISESDANAIIHAIEKLTPDKLAKLIVDNTIPHSLSYEAIQILAQTTATKAIAFLFSNSLNARAVDFFETVGKPGYPIEKFSDLSKAITWLLNH